jgi:VIT1/CCC1 family predicted Fe2+/Mn2+ transporter
MSMVAAVTLTALTLFGLGVGKAIVSEQRRIRSGTEMLALASVAGAAGYLIGIATRAVFGLEV